MFDLLKHDGNYLRVRGEYWPRVLWRRVCRELPPRARRIRHHRGHSQNREGTTSACAENTDLVVAVAPLLGNYLRVRGEYAPPRSRRTNSAELPPRARRIRVPHQPLGVTPGTTSACAENTTSGFPHCAPPGNYLRVRGEYPVILLHSPCSLELPPRARRIRCYPFHIRAGRGTTSACAENTASSLRSADSNWNYLRVRGEYLLCFSRKPTFLELPPRARRIHA